MREQNPPTVDEERFTGVVIMRGDDGYEAARLARIYQSRHSDQAPAAILTAASEADVVAGVRLARERGWRVGIRSGGHSFPAWGMRDDALMIDLGALKEMSYDEATGVVSATPAVQGGAELGPYLKRFGRFFQGGGCSSVGLGGFLVQGGIGWNFRGWGWSSEQLVAIDVVTAAGDLVRADTTQNSDLFWAARGAGPGMCGVITRFHIQTRPLPGALMSLLQAYPIDKYPEILAWLRETQGTISDKVHLNATSIVPPFPVAGHSDGDLAFVIWAVAFCDTEEESASALAPLTTNPFIADVLMDTGAHPTTLAAEHAFVDSGHPAGLRYRVDSAWVTGSTQEIVAASRRLATERPGNEPVKTYTFFQFTLPHDDPDMATPVRTDVMVGCYVIYEDAANDDDYEVWLRDAMGDLEPLTVGQYWGDSDQQHREVKCLTDPSWTRLQQIINERDPDGLFVGYLAGREGFQNENSWERETAHP